MTYHILHVQKLRAPGSGWNGEITSTVCIFLKTEHCALFMWKKEMIGDAGFSGGRERWSAIFDTDVTKVLQKDFAEKMVCDVGYCTPKLVNVSEDLHDDEVDPGMEGDDATEEIARKKRKKKRQDQGWCRII